MFPLAFTFQSPGPVIFEIGPVTVRWYGLLIASAVVIGVFLSEYLAKKREVKPYIISDLAVWLVIGAIPCARLYYVIFEWQQYADRPQDIFAIWQGGIAIHGAIIGGTVAALIFAKLNKVSFWQLADLVAPSLILGQAIGRWGNFFNSEAFGGPTDLPWKLYIPQIDQYVHPTFLYESIWNVMVFALLMFLFFWGLNNKDRLKTGTIVFAYAIAYSCGRIWIEGLRTDSLYLGPLRVAQAVSLIEIAIGIIGLIWLYKLNKPLPDVVSTTKKKLSEN